MGLFGNGGSNSNVGYNCGEINALRGVINDTAKKSAEDVVWLLNQQIITPMSSIWYAPEAVEFFNKFATRVKESGEKITEAFDNFRQSVENAGKSWADSTQGEAPSLPPIDNVELSLDVSEIKDKNEKGDVVIDEDRANNIVGGLAEVEEMIENALKKSAETLDAETAFIGHDQSSSLEECFAKVSEEIRKIFNFLTTGDDSLQSQITKTVQKYAEKSEEIKGTFASSK